MQIPSYPHLPRVSLLRDLSGYVGVYIANTSPVGGELLFSGMQIPTFPHPYLG